MKIGIFTGTFDPIHRGHIEFLKTAISLAALDKAALIAEKEPRQKHPFATWDHRQAMIERATKDLREVDHDYQFAAQLASGHTLLDLLQHGRTHYGAEHDFWFLVGSDSFEHLHKWHDVTNEQSYGGFIIALRDNHDEAWLTEKIKIAAGIAPRYVVISTATPQVSSSTIRSLAAQQSEITDVSADVAAYIKTHNLYR